MVLQQFIVASNAVLAWAAAIVSVWAAAKVSGWLKWSLNVQASLALFYSFAYWWLFFNLESGRSWSEVLRWFGLLSWPIAWSAVPIALVVYLRRSATSIEQKARDAVERTVGGL